MKTLEILVILVFAVSSGLPWFRSGFLADIPDLSGHYSRDWSEAVNVTGAISEPFAREFR